MPLTKSKFEDTRDYHHERLIRCRGYRLSDGLWEIEGRITDVKAYAFDNDYRGRITPPDPLHDMSMRLTLDDDMNVLAVEAVTDKSPFAVCPAITKNFQRLVGLRIAPGWNREIRKRLGGIQGCTHLVDLLGPLSTTAFQTIVPVLAREKGMAAMPSTDDGKEGKRPGLLNSCHAFSSKSPVVKERWPEWYDADSENTE